MSGQNHKKSARASISAFLGWDVPAEERRHPEVQLLLRKGLRSSVLFSVLCGVPSAALICAVLWRVSSHQGLLLFFLGSVVNSFVHWAMHLRLPADQDWLRQVVWSQLGGGLFWGLLPVLAMPADPSWQGFMLAFMLGVLATNSAFGARFASAFNAFNLGVAVPTTLAFLSLGTSLGNWSAAFVVYGTVFAAGLAKINRVGDTAASIYAVRSRELAVGIESERRLLAAQVLTDPLTGLVNRLGFGKALRDALDNPAGSGRVVGLAYIDIDGFKQINDSLGHRVGDELLVAVAARLSGMASPGETVARLSGDELTVLSPSIDSDAGAEELGRRLLDAFVQPFSLDGHELYVRSSVGVAEAEPGMSADELLRWADAALYNAKAEGGMCWCVFDVAMQMSLARGQSLRDSFAEAFDQGKIVPWYQPIVEISSGRIVGAEALVRWEAADGVRVAGAFLDEVSSLGLGLEIDESVALRVASLKRRIDQRFGPELLLTVNVSPRHLERFLQRPAVASNLAGLSVEVTEESSLANLAAVPELVDKIRAHGGFVLLDDFGVGYSSLQRLSSVPVDGIKLDRRFVVGLGESEVDAAIVASVSSICKRMKYRLIAEGIETQAQAKALAGFGVRHGQGWLYSAAVPEDRFLQMLANDERLGLDTSVSADLHQ